VLEAVLELGAIANAHQRRRWTQRDGIWHRAAAINDFVCIRIALTTPRDPATTPPAGEKSVARAAPAWRTHTSS
jgi:hypothetical protein